VGQNGAICHQPPAGEELREWNPKFPNPLRRWQFFVFLFVLTLVSLPAPFCPLANGRATVSSMLRLLFTWWHGDVWHGDWAGFEVAGPGLPDALLVFVGTRASAVEALEQQPPGTSWFVLECSQEKVGNDIKLLERVGGTGELRWLGAGAN
jgi:hypothetical protein